MCCLATLLLHKFGNVVFWVVVVVVSYCFCNQIVFVIGQLLFGLSLLLLLLFWVVVAAVIAIGFDGVMYLTLALCCLP